MNTKHLTAALFFVGLFFVSASYAQTCAPQPSGLVGWYRGENNTVDSSPTANNGALVGGATYAPGKVGQAFSLNGTDAYVEAPANSAQDPTTAGSQEAWVYFNQLPSATHTMEIIGKGGNGRDFDLQADTDNRFRLYVDGGVNVASTTVIQTGVWYHVVGTWDTTGLRIYVNGVLENTNGVQNLTRGQSGNPLQIGNQPTFGPRLFNGLIDEASIYNRALTDSEVSAIYNAGSAGKCLSATAAPVSISGRVVTASGRGIGNVRVSLTDKQGNIQTARTNTFGYYHFSDIQAGETYILSVSAKRFVFQTPTQVLSVVGDETEVNFTAYQIGRGL